MNRVLDNVLVALATLGTLLAVKHFIQPQIILYSIIMLILGAFFLIFLERIIDGQPNRIKSFLINTVGITLFVGGANFLMEMYNAQYWWIYGLVAFAIFEFHEQISGRF